MQLANRALLQVLLRGRNVAAAGQVSNDGLAHPAALQDPCPRVREAPFQVRNHAVVGALLTEVIGVLEVYLVVRAAYYHEPRGGGSVTFPYFSAPL
jgi:hypothetical protein